MIVAIIVGFFLFLMLGLWVNHNKAKNPFLSWNETASRLKPVQAEVIRALAMEQLQPASSLTKHNHHELWELIGGADGLARMSDNAKVFIELADYAAKTHPGEVAVVADRMRQDAKALRRALLGLEIAATVGYGRSRVSAYAQDAASSYYLMRERLLAIYKNTDGNFYPQLEAALLSGNQKS